MDIIKLMQIRRKPEKIDCGIECENKAQEKALGVAAARYDIESFTVSIYDKKSIMIENKDERVIFSYDEKDDLVEIFDNAEDYEAESEEFSM